MENNDAFDKVAVIDAINYYSQVITCCFPEAGISDASDCMRF
ncbi:MAG: hypothetical protein ACI8RD_002008 [Bacillariaceae sp.]|jgi:hypothetical protein